MKWPSVKLEKLKESRWHEYLIRFVFGGLVTVLAGWISKMYGPSFGGLFLAVPAIFPASVTLVQRHHERRAKRDGSDGEPEGKEKAGVDALGAAAGSVGLAGFALVIWKLASSLDVWPTLAYALAAWAVLSFASWMVLEAACGEKVRAHPSEGTA